MGLFLTKLKNRPIRIICLFLSLLLLYPAISYATPADVIDISDNKYFDAVHNCLRNAGDSIYVSIFLIITNERDKLSLPYLLVQDLIDAQKRGVKVVIRLDRNRENEDVYLKLSDAGIDCKFAIPNRTIHDKLIVIDKEIVIEGSMNWFSRSLKLNRESVSLIKSKEYAQEKIKRIETLEITEQGELDRAQIETVAIRNKFLRDPHFGANLVHNRNERGFDAYLFFLKDFQKTGQATFELDYERLAEYLGLDLSHSREYRWEINRVLKTLRDKYKLIDCKFIFDKPAEITLLDYEDRSKEYEIPENQYFKAVLRDQQQETPKQIFCLIFTI